MKVNWEEAIICDCIGQESGQPDFNCKFCGGTGFIYKPAVETVVISTSLNDVNKGFENIGLIEAGTAYVTSLSTILFGYHDRITFTEFSSKYSQPINILNGKSKILKRPIKSIVSLQRQNQFFNLEDFEICNNGWNIKCVNEALLEKYGKNFAMSILYVTNPIYCVADIMHELRATQLKSAGIFAELPKQYKIKREDFYFEK